MASLFHLFRPAPAVVRIIVASAFPALMFAAESHGAADPTDTLQVPTTAGMFWDDNLFRVPDGDPRAFGVDPAKKSDRIRRIGVGLKYDKTVSRQRFLADVNLEQNSYERNDNLDHIAGNAGTKWLWAIGSQWSGKLGYDHRRRLSGFADLSVNNVAFNTKNLVDQDAVSITGGYRLHPRWRVWGGLDFLEATNSSPKLIQNDTSITTGSLGVDYQTPSDNTIGLQLRYGEGLFPNRQVVASRLVNNQFTDTSPAMTWAWNLTGHSRFDGRLGYTIRKHEQFSARDFSGPTFQVRYVWVPTEKLRFDANALRELLTEQSDTSSFVVASGLRLTPQWAVTPKFSLRSVLSYETRFFQGDPGVVLGGTPVREDTLRTFQLAAVYAPWRNAELLVLLERGARTSNQQVFQFDYNSALVNLKLNF